MPLLLGFLLPVAAYVFLLYREAFRGGVALVWRRFRLAPPAAIALISSGTVLLVAWRTPFASGSTQIAWTAVEALEKGGPVRIGGDPEGVTLGWPNRAFSPALAITDEGVAAGLEVSRGGGFIRHGNHVLNGVMIPMGSVVQSGTFFFRLQRRWLWFGREAVITHRDGWTAATFELGAGSGRDRVLSLEPLMAGHASRLRRLKQATKAAELEDWAAPLRLLLAGSGEVRLLDPASQPVRAQVRLPASLTVLWTNLQLPLEIRRGSEGRLHVEFLPPWRLSSPVPPPALADTDEIRLTVTGRALPGDTALLMPFGGGLHRFTEVLEMADNRFAGPRKPAREASPFAPAQQEDEAAPAQRITSEKVVKAGPFGIRLATMRDLPQVGQLALGLLVAWLLLGHGLWVVWPRMRPLEGSVVGGLVAATWNLLAFRLMLAYRYALEPAHMDRLAVGGVTAALLALVALPGLILVIARLRRDRTVTFGSAAEGRRAGRWIFVYLLALGLGCLIEFWVAGSLWPNLSERFRPSVLRLETALMLGAWLLLLAHVFFRYSTESEDIESDRLSPTLRAKLETLRSFFTELPEIFRNFAKDNAPRLWRAVGSTADAEEDFEDADLDRPRFFPQVIRIVRKHPFRFASGLCGLLGAWLIVRWLLPAGVKVTQEILAPLLLCWLPALFWLAARLHFPPGSELAPGFRRGRALTRTLIALLLPVFLFPPLLGDAGGVVATLAVFVPVVVLLTLGGKPYRVGWLPFAALGVTLVLIYFAYLNIRPLLPGMGRVGQAGVRLLVFKEGFALKGGLLWFPVSRDEGTVTASRLSQGLQHTWENRAIAHEGRFLGLGLGNAPTRRSQVRQDTLQYDSTFSFFVVSEYGLVGGLSLLLLYSAPLLLVLLSGRARFDIGHAVATLITSACLLEALTHAGMNLAIMPFTGRDLPMLAVNSNTDLLRWAILFGLAAQAVLWRVSGEREGYTLNSDSVISAHPDPVAGGGGVDLEPAAGFQRKAAALLLVPAVGFLAVLIGGVRVGLGANVSSTFDWSDLQNALRQLIDKGQIRVDGKTKTLLLDPKLGGDGGTLLEQEIARFNALTDEEKLEGSVFGAKEFRARLEQVRSLRDYDDLMAEMQRLSSAETPPRRPLLFDLMPPLEWADEEQTVRTWEPEYGVAPNPAFNTRLSFKTGLGPGDFPLAAFRDGAAGSYLIRGRGFEFTIPNRRPLPRQTRTITLQAEPNGALRVRQDTASQVSRAMVVIRFYPAGKAGLIDRTLGEFEVRLEGLRFRRGQLRAGVRGPRDNKAAPVGSGMSRVLRPGDTVETPEQIGESLRPALTVQPTSRGALIGPAWVMGTWVATYDPDPLVPWTAHLSAALSSEWSRLGPEAASRRYSSVSIDQTLQEATQRFAVQKGREHHRELLAGGGPREAIPPRVALSVIDITNGEALAFGGWPRMTSDRFWTVAADNERIPPVNWVEERSPKSLRRRYAGDRNFDRIEVGSASKPLWASAVLAVHPGLNQRLSVSGPGEEESDVFGIPITPSWHVGASSGLRGGAWCDFTSYLARSDNRYQVRLGFLGLAESDPGTSSGIAAEEGPSPSTRESLDGGRTAWRRYPRFRGVLEFCTTPPQKMRTIEETPLATRLNKMYAAGIRRGEINRRLSFWTNDESDDQVAANEKNGKARPSPLFTAISPEAPDLALDLIDHPRKYVTLLLGGGTNLWSNIDFAGAFATCVRGKPIVVHATRVSSSGQTEPDNQGIREAFPDIAPQLHPGLRAVVLDPGGTANTGLAQTGALALIRSLPRVDVLAKTGTLARRGASGHTSRILLALVRWNPSRTDAERGVVFSLVVERAEMGAATRWLGDFMVQNAAEIRRLLSE